MKKQIGTLSIGILMLSLAMAMYAGDTMTFETALTEPAYTVVGNSSNLIGLNITFEDGNILITPAINYKPDNFTLIFFDNTTLEVETIVYRGGHSHTRYVDRNITVPLFLDRNVTEYIETEPIIINNTITEPEEGSTFLWVIISILGAIIAVLLLFSFIRSR